MGMLTQFITSTQFYLFGRSRFTQTGWQKAAKKYVQGELEECKLQGKCYAVTGANSGIGRETAGFLASRGARVVARRLGVPTMLRPLDGRPAIRVRAKG